VGNAARKTAGKGQADFRATSCAGRSAIGQFAKFLLSSAQPLERVINLITQFFADLVTHFVADSVTHGSTLILIRCSAGAALFDHALPVL
jgi:hypothetical protein